MKCSECNVELRPVVAIDIDGTLGDYHTSLTRFVVNYYDLPMPQAAWNGHGNFEDYLHLSHEDYSHARLAWRQGGGKRTMQLFMGAKELMDALHKARAEVWLTTTRPYNKLDSTDPDTQFWLYRHGIVFDHLLYDEHKYMKLRDIVGDRVVYVLEDLPEQFDAANALWPGKVGQIERPHNTDATQERQPKHHNLMEAASVILGKVAQWK